MFSNSFGWWLFNLGVTMVWLGGSIATGNYFLAAGALIYVLFTMLVELPDASSEEGSAEDEDIRRTLPPA
jgi:hypothetical protein